MKKVFAACELKSKAPWIGLALLGGALWLGLINQLRGEWSINPQYTYGWGVPVLSLYLIWLRWRDRPQPRPYACSLAAFIAASLLFVLLPIRLVQEANPDWRLVSWSYSVAVVALTLWAVWYAGGKAWTAHFSFPILMLLLAVPWPTPIESALTQTLMRAVASITVELLNWLGMAARQQGNLIELSSGILSVNEACSGVRSFQATVMAAFFLGELYRFNWKGRLALIGLGMALALSLNLARAFTLAWISSQRGTTTLGFWHDPAGYSVVGLAFLVLLAASHAWKKKSATPTFNQTHPQNESASTDQGRATVSGRPLPLAVLVGSALWMIGIEASTEWWYRSHESNLAPATRWTLDWPQAGTEFKFQEIDPEVKRILRYTRGQAALWRKENGQQWLIYFFNWEPGRTAAQLARSHSPEICLPAGGLKMLQDNGTQIIEAGSLKLPFRTYLFDYKGRPLFLFYCLWEQRAGGPSQDQPFSRSQRLQAVFQGRRHLGQQLLEIAILGAGSRSEAEQDLRSSLEQLIQVESQRT